MTQTIITNIKSLNDLLNLSKVYKEGQLTLNITKIANSLNKDRKTIKKYLNGHIPKKNL